MRKISCFTLKLAIAIICFSQTVVLAEVTDEKSQGYSPDAYHIELIIFSRNTSVNSADQLPEHWPTAISMQYPVNIISFDELFNEGLSQPSDQMPVSLSGPEATTSATKAPFNHLNRALSRLKRSSRFSVLFNQSWIQSVAAGEKYRPILINGGEKYGNFFELSGNIQLERSRFIHLTTNLWLTKTNLSGDSIQLVNIELLDEIMQEWAWPIPPESPFEQQLSGVQESVNPQDSHGFMETEPLNLYPPEHTLDIERISVLQTKTRVKTKKATHIDHPLFGVLINISRVSD